MIEVVYLSITYPTVSSHDFNHETSFVGGGCTADCINRRNNPVQGTIGPDSHVCTKHIII